NGQPLKRTPLGGDNGANLAYPGGLKQGVDHPNRSARSHIWNAGSPGGTSTSSSAGVLENAASDTRPLIELVLDVPREPVRPSDTAANRSGGIRRIWPASPPPAPGPPPRYAGRRRSRGPPG